jgi:hypothetical protein
VKGRAAALDAVMLGLFLLLRASLFDVTVYV